MRVRRQTIGNIRAIPPVTICSFGHRQREFREQLNRPGFVGGLILREDAAHATIEQVLPRAA
jgi:hypothetical protein